MYTTEPVRPKFYQLFTILHASPAPGAIQKTWGGGQGSEPGSDLKGGSAFELLPFELWYV